MSAGKGEIATLGAGRCRESRIGRMGRIAEARRWTAAIPPRAGRRGRAGARLLVLILGLAVLALVGAFWAGGKRGAGGEDEVRPAPPGPPGATGGPESLAAGRVAAPPGESDPERTAAPIAEPGIGARPGTDDPLRFAGPPGTVRGHVEAAGDLPFPPAWTLVLEPSRFLVGRERAERREIAFGGEVRDFEVAGLPLAGYDVRAVAPGRNGHPVPVLLERRSPEAYVNLSLAPAGFLAGVVLDANAAAVDGLAVTLEALPGGPSLVATTDATGSFRFEDVLDGSYKLHYGDPRSPVREAQVLQLRAPGMVLPPATVPELAGVWILVLDLAGAFVEGATVRGTGSAGGLLEGTTGARGLLLVRHLPPGRYRIRVEHPALGSVRDTLDLEAGAVKEVTVRMR
ncbi:MAG: carboxypeptidase-like regulatory domain-containing protein [Planctomycetota bacterium]